MAGETRGAGGFSVSRMVSGTLAALLAVLACLLGGLVFALVAGTLAPLAPTALPSPRLDAPRHRVLVLSSAIHTDIALPAEPAVLSRFSFAGEPGRDKPGLPLLRPDVAHLVLGWGGRSFYIETPSLAEMKIGPLRRAFAGDASVMHVELAAAIDPAAPGVRAFDLGDPAFEALLRFLEARFARDETGRPILLEGAGYGAFDRFYEAKGSFNALFGCNVFTAEALRAAGIATGAWTPLPLTLFLSLDLHG